MSVFHPVASVALGITSRFRPNVPLDTHILVERTSDKSGSAATSAWQSIGVIPFPREAGTDPLTGVGGGGGGGGNSPENTVRFIDDLPLDNRRRYYRVMEFGVGVRSTYSGIRSAIPQSGRPRQGGANPTDDDRFGKVAVDRLLPGKPGTTGTVAKPWIVSPTLFDARTSTMTYSKDGSGRTYMNFDASLLSAVAPLGLSPGATITSVSAPMLRTVGASTVSTITSLVLEEVTGTTVGATNKLLMQVSSSEAGSWVTKNSSVMAVAVSSSASYHLRTTLQTTAGINTAGVGKVTVNYTIADYDDAL